MSLFLSIFMQHFLSSIFLHINLILILKYCMVFHCMHIPHFNCPILPAMINLGAFNYSPPNNTMNVFLPISQYEICSRIFCAGKSWGICMPYLIEYFLTTLQNVFSNLCPQQQHVSLYIHVKVPCKFQIYQVLFSHSYCLLLVLLLVSLMEQKLQF